MRQGLEKGRGQPGSTEPCRGQGPEVRGHEECWGHRLEEPRVWKVEVCADASKPSAGDRGN